MGDMTSAGGKWVDVPHSTLQPSPYETELPEEILCQIFSFLDLVSLSRCAQVCRLWRVIALDPPLWEELNLSVLKHELEGHDIHRVVAQCGASLRKLRLQNNGNVSKSAMARILKCCAALEVIQLGSSASVSDVTFRQVAASCRNLRELDLEGCSCVSDKGLVAVGERCKLLEVFRVSSSSMSMTCRGLESIVQGCPCLKYFFVEHSTRIYDPLLEAFAENCTNLRYLHLKHCDMVSDGAVAKLANGCRGLTHLVLRGCRDTTSASLMSLAHHCIGLEALDMLGSYELGGNGLPALAARCTALKELTLEKGPRTDRCKLWKLHLIILDGRPHDLNDLCRGGVTDASLLGMGRCENLEFLNLSENYRLTDEVGNALLDNVETLVPLASLLSALLLHLCAINFWGKFQSVISRLTYQLS